MIPNEIQQEISRFFSSKNGFENQIKASNSALGITENNYLKVEIGSESYFLKWGKTESFPKMYAHEKEGLEALAQSKGLKLPQIILQYDGVEFSCLLLEWIESAVKQVDFWQNFAIGLAEQHKKTSEQFGWQTDNYIGKLAQRNHWDSVWNDFFWTHRIEPQLKLARNNGFAYRSDAQLFENLYYKMDKIVPNEKPALLHGDLWKGNFMTDEIGNPCVFDPAVYYGNREVDLAMTVLFGGFSKEFYQTYNEVFPLEKEWEDRLDIWNLYPLLVHTNMFGEGFLSEVRRNIRRFV